MSTLGLNFTVLVMAVEGYLSVDEEIEALNQGIQLVGMTPIGKPFIQYFPMDGKGGVGETVTLAATVAQPLVFQALAESFSFILPGVGVIDSWPEHREPHGGFFVTLATCGEWQDEYKDVLRDFLTSKGLKVIDMDLAKVSLV